MKTKEIEKIKVNSLSIHNRPKNAEINTHVATYQYKTIKNPLD
jgi:hypothetical protein